MPEPLARFNECVTDAIRYRGVGSPAVQHTVAIIEDEFGDAGLTLTAVAERLEVGPKALSALFSGEVGLTFSEYLRDLRLDRAATLLATTDARIKEVWAQVGFNDGSNFVHQFKARFGVTPGDYRAAVIHPAMGAAVAAADPPVSLDRRSSSRDPMSVLIVEDDVGTRDAHARYLRLQGDSVAIAGTGQEGLRLVDQVGPGAVLLDYHLPDTGGLDWLRALRARTRTRWPGVLVFTADVEVEEHVPEIRALGGMMTSKLCGLTYVERLLRSLAMSAALHALGGADPTRAADEGVEGRCA